MSENTTLHVKNLTEEANTDEVLRPHFQQFGQVLQIRHNLAKRFAQVAFADHDSAAQAKKQGKVGRIAHGCS